MLASLASVGLVLALALATKGSSRISEDWATATRGFRYPVLSTTKWSIMLVFVVAVAAGWVTVPGAVIGFGRMIRSRDVRRRAFA